VSYGFKSLKTYILKNLLFQPWIEQAHQNHFETKRAAVYRCPHAPWFDVWITAASWRDATEGRKLTTRVQLSSLLRSDKKNGHWTEQIAEKNASPAGKLCRGHWRSYVVTISRLRWTLTVTRLTAFIKSLWLRLRITEKGVCQKPFRLGNTGICKGFPYFRPLWILVLKLSCTLYFIEAYTVYTCTADIDFLYLFIMKSYTQQYWEKKLT